ncbi:MAG: hypothetical protein GC179_23795 [Anaerolineaceae bacterium]|nr:hypothetical protein [Anaerolineaceae bacterium]
MANQSTPNPAPQSGAKVYEMQWDCKFCGTKKLLGKTHRFCPNCGAQQDPTWRYFPSDAEKVAVQDHVYVGADIICKACQTLNSGKSEFCGNCGAPLSDAARAAQGASRTKDDGQTLEAEDLKQRQLSSQVPALAAKPAAKKGGGILSKWKLIALVVVVLIGGAIFALTRTTKATAYVTGYKWNRSIDIQSLQPVHGKTTCDRMPSSAYNVTRNYEQVDTKQVADGETCQTKQVDQGDGTFREERQCQTKYRSEPVMGYMCTYVTNQWVGSAPVTASGDKTNAPYWPESKVSNCLTIGCTRESGRDETYTLMLKGDGNRPFECKVAYDLWQSTPLEKGFDVEVGTLLHNFLCSTLKPK